MKLANKIMEGKRQPLIVEKEGDSWDKGDNSAYNRLVNPAWRNYMIMPLGFLFITSYAISFFTTIQFTFYFIRKQHFPNESTTSLTRNSICNDNVSSSQFEKFETAQGEASHWNLYFSIALGIPAMFSCLILGAYTDRVGRKMVLLISMGGTFVRTLVSTIGIYTEMELVYFVFGFIVEGLCGYLVNMLQASHAYVADITHNGKNRSLAFVGLALIYGLGAIIGTLVTGVIIQYVGFAVSIDISLGLLFISLCGMFFILPETITKETGSQFRSVSIHLRNAFAFYTHDERKCMYWFIITAFFFFSLTLTGRYTVETLYFWKEPFCWNPFHIGWFEALGGLIRNFMGLLMVKVLRHGRGLSDAFLVLIGCTSAIGSQLTIAFARTDLTLYIALVVGIGSLLPVSLTKAMVSSLTPADKQGAVFASFAAVETFCQMCSGILANAIYSATVHVCPGCVFIVFGACCLISAILILILMLVYKSRQTTRLIRSENSFEIKSD